MLNYLKKVFRFGAQSFARNFWLTILTISILVLLILSVNILTVLNFLTDEASKQIQSKVDISIFLKPGVSDEEANGLRSYLLGLPSVERAIYTRPDDVLSQFKKDHQDEPEILDSLSFLEENPFGGVIVLKTIKAADYKAIVKQLESPVYAKLIDNKDFGDHERLVEKIESTSGFIKNFIVIISLLFAFIAMVIVYNTIKIAIYTHREEMAIMRLVGASNWFVRGQFIVEVVIYSFIASLVAFILIFPIISLVQPRITEFFGPDMGNIFAYYRDNFFSLFGIQFLMVAVLSSLSAGLAIGKYIKK